MPCLEENEKACKADGQRREENVKGDGEGKLEPGEDLGIQGRHGTSPFHASLGVNPQACFPCPGIISVPRTGTARKPVRWKWREAWPEGYSADHTFGREIHADMHTRIGGEARAGAFCPDDIKRAAMKLHHLACEGECKAFLARRT